MAFRSQGPQTSLRLTSHPNGRSKSTSRRLVSGSLAISSSHPISGSHPSTGGLTIRGNLSNGANNGNPTIHWRIHRCISIQP